MPAALYLCIHARDFAAQALAREHKLGARALAILSGTLPLERVFAMNAAARQQGMALGMSRVRAESFSLTLLRRSRDCEDSAFAELVSSAERFSPRVEAIAAPCEESCGATLVLDISGSERLFGSAQQIASTVCRAVGNIGFEASVVASHNACTALLKARGLPGASAIASGDEAHTLTPLPLYVLQPDEAQAETFSAWGIHTLGELAALPTKALAARMGPEGVRLQAEARGNAAHLLVPEEEAADAPLRESLELEHPVELLEPLLLLLSQMLETLLQRAATRSLAIASVETCLVLDGPSNADARTEHRCEVRPTLPERDRLILLKLIQLDLELHPPAAAVIAMRVTAYPARPQTAQQGLFAALAPEAGTDGDFVGAPAKAGGRRPRRRPRTARHPRARGISALPTSRSVTAVSRAPAPKSASSRLCSAHDAPAACGCRRVARQSSSCNVLRRTTTDAANTSGPWCSSGAWWTHPAWCREEWDVVLQEEPQRCLRLAHDPSASCWYVIGIYD